MEALFMNFVRSLLIFLVALMGNGAYADCRASVFADDWQELGSVNEVNAWCGARADWYRVDKGKYQPKSYCSTSKQSKWDSYGREYFVYPTLFWWHLKSFSYYYQEDVLNNIHWFLRDFSYKGWPSSIKIKFDPKCY
jgi:hypothetical protein